MLEHIQNELRLLSIESRKKFPHIKEVCPSLLSSHSSELLNEQLNILRVWIDFFGVFDWIAECGGSSTHSPQWTGDSSNDQPDEHPDTVPARSGLWNQGAEDCSHVSLNDAEAHSR